MLSPTVLDLFCGCGGISWGFRQAGFRILAGIDNWKTALNTFNLNHPESKTIHGNLSQYDPCIMRHELQLRRGQLDCMVGGPPCQGFSRNVPATYRFLEDPRNQLFRVFLAFVNEFRPKTILMENVAEIYNAYGGAVRQEILDTLDKLGYSVKVAVIFAPEYGIPQRRRRCFFMASLTGILPDFPLPLFGLSENATLFTIIRKYRTAWEAISDLPKLQNGEGSEPVEYECAPQNDFQASMRNNSTMLYDHITRKLTDRQMARLLSLKPGENIKHLPSHIRPKAGYSGAYGRLDFEMLAPTITRWVFHPGSGRYSHPREVRLITIREAARIQSFSDDFRFTGTYIEKSHQVGNAVPPLLAYLIADNLKHCLGLSTTNQQLPTKPAV